MIRVPLFFYKTSFLNIYDYTFFEGVIFKDKGYPFNFTISFFSNCCFHNVKQLSFFVSRKMPFNLKNKLTGSLLGGGFHSVLESVFDAFAFGVKSFYVGKQVMVRSSGFKK